MSVAVGTALISLVGSVVGSVTDKSAKDAESELQAWMDSNKDLLSSNVVPMIMIGTVTVVGIFAIAVSNSGKGNDNDTTQ